ncbi:unknown [Ruminococcus sp. CAG:60]|nr:unknown [Ruminococcus sp. CAG:60]
MAHPVFFGLKYEFTVFYESTHRMNTISPFLGHKLFV